MSTSDSDVEGLLEVASHKCGSSERHLKQAHDGTLTRVYTRPLSLLSRVRVTREAGVHGVSNSMMFSWFFLGVERGHHELAAPHNAQAGPRRATYAGDHAPLFSSLALMGRERRVFTA